VNALSGRVERAERGAVVESFEEALASARARDFRYAVLPVISHWEERATEWSGIPDRVAIKIHVADVATGEVIDSADVSGKSRWLTFGGDHPEELLPSPIDDYVSSLFE
jgi:hypothetical protein